MAHIFHFLLISLVFEIVNPFSWIFNAISSDKSCLTSSWRQDTRIFPVCWILIGQFKFPAPAVCKLLNSTIYSLHFHYHLRPCFPQREKDMMMMILITSSHKIKLWEEPTPALTTTTTTHKLANNTNTRHFQHDSPLILSITHIPLNNHNPKRKFKGADKTSSQEEI